MTVQKCKRRDGVREIRQKKKDFHEAQSYSASRRRRRLPDTDDDEHHQLKSLTQIYARVKWKIKSHEMNVIAAQVRLMTILLWLDE